MRRLDLVVAAIVTLAVAAPAAPAAAQAGRIRGVVQDTNGDPIQGALVRATHPDAPRELTAATDDKGRFAIIGMRLAPNWKFIAEAPGYHSTEGSAPVRSQLGPPITFTLIRDPGPIPGALAEDITAQLDAAKALRSEGQIDKALAAYEAIQGRNARLTAVNLVIADVYREKATAERDAATRQAFLRKAVAAYETILKEDAGHERARSEMAVVAAQLQQPAR
jgi:hypothetical protein